MAPPDDNQARNDFDNMSVDRASFAFKNLMGIDKWTLWTPVFTGLTLVGTPVYTGRFRFVGRQCFFQVQMVPGTTIASVAGTSYMALPSTALGLGGMATMTNDSTNVAVGVCHIDAATSRAYLPAQAASGSTFTLAGWLEV